MAKGVILGPQPVTGLAVLSALQEAITLAVLHLTEVVLAAGGLIGVAQGVLLAIEVDPEVLSAIEVDLEALSVIEVGQEALSVTEVGQEALSVTEVGQEALQAIGVGQAALSVTEVGQEVLEARGVDPVALYRDNQQVLLVTEVDQRHPDRGQAPHIVQGRAVHNQGQEVGRVQGHVLEVVHCLHRAVGKVGQSLQQGQGLAPLEVDLAHQLEVRVVHTQTALVSGILFKNVTTQFSLFKKIYSSNKLSFRILYIFVFYKYFGFVDSIRSENCCKLI